MHFDAAQSKGRFLESRYVGKQAENAEETTTETVFSVQVVSIKSLRNWLDYSPRFVLFFLQKDKLSTYATRSPLITHEPRRALISLPALFLFSLLLLSHLTAQSLVSITPPATVSTRFLGSLLIFCGSTWRGSSANLLQEPGSQESCRVLHVADFLRWQVSGLTRPSQERRRMERFVRTPEQG